jgi:hypothetical protein
MIKTWIATRGPPRARKLLSHFEIGRELRVYEEHRAGRIRQQMLESLHAGQTVALIARRPNGRADLYPGSDEVVTRKLELRRQTITA